MSASLIPGNLTPVPRYALTLPSTRSGFAFEPFFLAVAVNVASSFAFTKKR